MINDINDTSGARSYAGAPFSTGRNSEDCAPITSGGTSVCNANRNPGHAALCYCDAGNFHRNFQSFSVSLTKAVGAS